MDVEPPPTPFFFQVYLYLHMLLKNRYLGIGVTGSEMCKSIEINGVTYITQQYIISEESQLLFFNILLQKKCTEIQIYLSS